MNDTHAGVLFPIMNDTQPIPETITTVVGSPVLAATVGTGLDFAELSEPVRILLRLNMELDPRVGGEQGCCNGSL